MVLARRSPSKSPERLVSLGLDGDQAARRRSSLRVLSARTLAVAFSTSALMFGDLQDGLLETPLREEIAIFVLVHQLYSLARLVPRVSARRLPVPFLFFDNSLRSSGVGL